MKNFIDPMQLSCQSLILKKLENREVRYLMHQKKWLKNSILVLGVFMKYGTIVNVSNKGLFYLLSISLLWIKIPKLIRRNRLLKRYQKYHLYPFRLQRFQKIMVEKRRLK